MGPDEVELVNADDDPNFSEAAREARHESTLDWQSAESAKVDEQFGDSGEYEAQIEQWSEAELEAAARIEGDPSSGGDY